MKLIHYSDKLLTEVHSATQVEEKHSWMKPKGLWVSVEGEDDWPSWCRNANYGLNRLAHAHEVILHDSANILHLKNETDIDNFSKEFSYGLLPEERLSIRVYWCDVAARWSGIIIAPYCWRRRLDDRTMWYYGWDCASGCIWDASAIASVNLIEQEPRQKKRLTA